MRCPVNKQSHSAMLRASADSMESSCRVAMLAIREKELLFFSKNCWLIANLSALLAGFGYTGLVYTKYIDSDLCDPKEFMCAEMTYPICVTITMGLSLFSTCLGLLVGKLHGAVEKLDCGKQLQDKLRQACRWTLRATLASDCNVVRSNSLGTVAADLPRFGP